VKKVIAMTILVLIALSITDVLTGDQMGFQTILTAIVSIALTTIVMSIRPLIVSLTVVAVVSINSQSRSRSCSRSHDGSTRTTFSHHCQDSIERNSRRIHSPPSHHDDSSSKRRRVVFGR